MKNKITKEDVDKVLAGTQMIVETYAGKTTIIKATLPSGFVLVEHSSCVDPKNYDKDLGSKICMDKIFDKIWELEGYRLQCELADKEEVEVL